MWKSERFFHISFHFEIAGLRVARSGPTELSILKAAGFPVPAWPALAILLDESSRALPEPEKVENRVHVCGL